MRYVAAALLAALGGQDINAKNLKKILSSVGVDVDDEKVEKVVSELAGKSVDDLLAEGKDKVGSVPAGGAAPASGGAAPAGAAPAAAAAAPAAKVEEEEEEDDDMGFGLFD
uniref:Large ribosomal subunit protein P2 n=1 Tax=Pseudodiaptomus poplesia TaxID=213370 RepID=A0A0U2KDK0_9MAXI|nr:hypothetical protein [Pseudodiaptomus poplesia]ALS04960.1 hypothetical protein [Pseudodiaptomus poplesia]